MENALLFTGLLLGAALAGGYFGSCCKSRQGEELAQKLQALQDRLEFLETRVQDVDGRLCLCERTDAENVHRVYDWEMATKIMEDEMKLKTEN